MKEIKKEVAELQKKKLEVEKEIKELQKKKLEIEEEQEKLINIKYFETVVILSEDILLKRFEEIEKEIKNIIKSIDKIEYLGIKKLAYAIKKHESGYYIVFYWQGTEETEKQLKLYFKNIDEIIKFIIVTVEEDLYINDIEKR